MFSLSPARERRARQESQQGPGHRQQRPSYTSGGIWAEVVVTHYLWVPDHFPQVILQPLGLPLINASPYHHPGLFCSQEP